MEFQNELQTTQEIVYKTFTKALEQNKLSHAYLIKGNEGAPLIETAKYLAKSLICEHPNPLACEHCMSCIRFDEGNYADFILLDGSKNNIKISDIENLQTFFQNTSSEKSGKMIYIIHLLENSNRESLNAILKFLEEPADNVYAFITTYNEEKLLPTILSRTQHLKLLPLSKEKLYLKCKNSGISDDDFELLSLFYHNSDTLIDVAQSSDYLHIKDQVFDILEMLNRSCDDALFYLQTNLIPTLKDKVSVRLFLNILAVAFKDVLNASLSLPIVLRSHSQLINELNDKIEDVEKCYMEIMLSRGKIETNVNLSLLLEHVFITMYKGEK